MLKLKEDTRILITYQPTKLWKVNEGARGKLLWISHHALGTEQGENCRSMLTCSALSSLIMIKAATMVDLLSMTSQAIPSNAQVFFVSRGSRNEYSF